MTATMTYTNLNGYQIPNLSLPPQPTQELGRYGRLRKNFLQQNAPLAYETMLLDGTLFPQLSEMEVAAEQMIAQTMTELLKQNPTPDRKTDPMGWAQRMNSAKAQAEELVTPMLYNL